MIHLQRTPRVNTNDDSVQLVAWNLAPGAFVEAGQEIADVETSKATVGVEAERSGYLRPLVAVGEVVAVGAPLALLADSTEEALAAEWPNARDTPADTQVAQATPPAPSQALPATAASTAPNPELGATRFSPAALRRLSELGLSADAFAGRGLVTVRDLERHPAPALQAEPAHPPSLVGGTPLSLAKRAETAALQLGAQGGVVSQLTVQFDSEGIRRRLLREGLFDGQPLPLILYELARLLPQFPALNAWCDGERVHHHAEVLIGLALDLGQGLKVVNLPGLAEQLPAPIHARVLDAAQRYLDKTLRPEELDGGSFSVTDLSGLDVLHFRPLINGRQSAILGIGGDSQASGQPLSLTLAFDHRCSNGRDVGLFLQQLRDRLLAYADPVPVAAPVDAGKSLAAALRALAACDLCGIERDSYYRSFGRYAFFHAYVRADGSLGAACHRCVGGTA
ncbi:2-oxo acid dehydrogenase subunit E2 [Inhella sp.]|uniref:2-oxo acid dehydrogenase subunit E2 n=1 Tax=Inhella sp. TaxID=1921806 RepID=UPI0035B0104B